MPKIENVKNITALVRFMNSNPAVSNDTAHIYVSFWQKDDLRGLGSDHPLNNLVISAQMDKDHADAEYRTYGWRVSYRDMYSVRMADARRMYETLAMIERGLEKLKGKYGYPQTYGQYVVRVLNVLGVTYGMVSTHRQDPIDAHIHYSKVGDLIYPIDKRATDKMNDWFGAPGWMVEQL